MEAWHMDEAEEWEETVGRFSGVFRAHVQASLAHKALYAAYDKLLSDAL